MQEAPMEDDSSDEEEEPKKKQYTVDDLNLDALKIQTRKKNKNKAQVKEMEVEMDPKVLKKTKAIQKKEKKIQNRRKKKAPAKVYRTYEHKWLLHLIINPMT